MDMKKKKPSSVSIKQDDQGNGNAVKTILNQRTVKKEISYYSGLGIPANYVDED